MPIIMSLSLLSLSLFLESNERQRGEETALTLLWILNGRCGVTVSIPVLPFKNILRDTQHTIDQKIDNFPGQTNLSLATAQFLKHINPMKPRVAWFQSKSYSSAFPFTPNSQPSSLLLQLLHWQIRGAPQWAPSSPEQPATSATSSSPSASERMFPPF